MADVTRQQLDKLVENLRSSDRELREEEAGAADAMTAGADRIEGLASEGKLEAAEEAAFELWKELLEFGVIKSVFPTMAPGAATPAQATLPNTSKAIGFLKNTFVDVRSRKRL